MKDYLKQLLPNVDNPLRARSLVREYLQARLLQTLQDQHAFATWAFVGGTALRFLFGLPRFSEDLDFSLTTAGAGSRFRETLTVVKRAFVAEGYDVAVKLKEDKTVKSAFVRFAGLLFELGLSPHASETLAIKVEIDTNPPAGATIETTVVRRHVVLHLQHYDRASLLAGKLHALLTRPYTKGRDIYDLIWYFSDRGWPEPNLAFLNNALQQSGRSQPSLTTDTWRNALQKRLAEIDWNAVVRDVGPFLERAGEVSLLTYEQMKKLIETG